MQDRRRVPRCPVACVVAGLVYLALAWAADELDGLRGERSEDSSLRIGGSATCPVVMPPLGSKVLEHRQDASVVFGGGWELELGEDVCDMFLDGAFGDDELLADRLVRPSFGH